MQVKELKEYICQDKKRIYTLLEAAGCHDINESSQNEIRCATPDGDNKTSVVVKISPTLYTSMYSLNYSGDLLGAIQELMRLNFSDTIMFVHSVLGLSRTYNKNLRDPLSLLKQYSVNYSDTNSKHNKLYPRTYLNRFVNGLHKNLIEEGILPNIARQFSVCYDPKLSRIIFPHFDWVNYDKIVGVKGRTTFDADIADELDIPKYWNYINGYLKTHNLYGYYLAKPFIAKKKQVILFEAEKSVMKHFSIMNGEGFSVALGGHSISDEQVKFLLKNTDSECEIIFAYDKDVMVNKTLDNGKDYNGLNYLKSEAAKFMKLRNTSFVFDSHDILGEKSSPIDEGVKKWNYLYKWRTKIK